MSTLRYLSFVFVGAVAAAVHYGVVVALVSIAHWHPLVGNVGGYCVAVVVSYFGQARLTFQRTDFGVAQFARFLATSFTGFIINSASYAALLQWTPLDYRLSLGIVLVGVAVLTYVLMKFWVFVGSSRVAA
jgi:putative flippase GtrA